MWPGINDEFYFYIFMIGDYAIFFIIIILVSCINVRDMREIALFIPPISLQMYWNEKAKKINVYWI